MTTQLRNFIVSNGINGVLVVLGGAMLVLGGLGLMIDVVINTGICTPIMDGNAYSGMENCEAARDIAPWLNPLASVMFVGALIYFLGHGTYYYVSSARKQISGR